jgi:Protein of unknown function (DUF2867)
MAGPAARRIQAPDRTLMLDEIPDADYICAFEFPRSATDRRTAEQWAQAVFEGPPIPVRTFLTAGWRIVLRLRLGPRPAKDHVLGWRIRPGQPDLLVVEADSHLITAHNVVQVDDTRVIWTTFVGYRNLVGRVAWALAAPFHIAVIPRLLRHAARAD